VSRVGDQDRGIVIVSCLVRPIGGIFARNEQGENTALRNANYVGKAENMILPLEKTTTVRELVGRYPRTRLVFEKHGIDYCCGGSKCLADAAIERDIEFPALVEDLRRSLRPTRKNPDAAERDWYAATLGELIFHIVETHHGYMKTALPWLRSLVPLIVKAHEDKHGNLLWEVQTIFNRLDEELSSHLFKEEHVLFPYIEALEKHVVEGEPRPMPLFGSAVDPIRQMEKEHEEAGGALAKLREVTNGYALPLDACPSFMAVYEELQRMEADLHQHIHLENNILFPRTIDLEENAAS
jgi:regulator of cell morphogenesis and NO signaling